ncbi:unnamed protein product [Microthlaspi erraticum]|uniref:Thioredoxin domain-containing protein n=1 Tax=Microthlaspi erraticum TaxID=1685480 RepID=A0A6D2HCK5_9BRAS|nr:unnamed protein product [Microthlaspi erraticum]
MTWSTPQSLNKEVPSISGSEWESLVIQSTVPVMVMFTSVWCGPCRVIDPVLDQMDVQFTDRFKFYRIDIEKESDIANRYFVRSVPTTIVFLHGNDVARVPGLDIQGLWDIVDRYAN